MSHREHWPEVRSSVKDGEVISGCRDNDTRSYRLFVNKGWRDVNVAGVTGCQIDSCMCCDLSIEDLKSLEQVIHNAVAQHEPWPPDLGDCVSCDCYVLSASEFPHCPTCARLVREGKPL